MGNKQTSIVLNGKLYDAVTGTLIHAPAPSSAPKPRVEKKSGLVMDGFVRQPAKKHKKSAVKHAPAPKATHTNHHPTHTQPHKPQRAATLMRSAVSKPVKASHHKPEPSPSQHIHDERTAARLERAQAVPKSQLIHKFPRSHAAQRSVTKKHSPVAVTAAPAEPPLQHHSPAPLSASETLVTNALKHATAHEANHPYAKKPKKRMAHSLGFKRHTANLAMGGLAILILAGFFTYQNIPNLSLQLASNRAGFQAHMPHYQPSGFSQDNLVTYGPGKVTISFTSNSDDRQFQLTQQVSNWNSQSLATNYLGTNNKQYQTYQAGGKTVYIYDNANATWVNGGVWYQIEGKSSLTSDQLLKIASSI